MRANEIRVNFLLVLSLSILAVFLPVQPSAFGRSSPPGTNQGQTVKRGIVILVEFPDVKNELDRNIVRTRFSRHLNEYVRQMSYNRVSLEIDLTERWYQMPNAVTRYSISSRNLEVDRSRVMNLILDAVNAADGDVDFSRYDFAAVFMAAKMKEYGMIGLCGYPGMLGWKTEDMLRTRSGQSVHGGIAIFSYQAHLGTLFHDIAHIIGGVKGGKRMVPCLYDHDLQAKPGPLRETAEAAMINMGFWDPMSCHFYKRNAPPPGLSSWTKMRLNWIDPSKIKVVDPGQKADLMLGPLEDASSETLVIKIPLSETTYYLIENRQPIGFDAHLPGNGVLIMVADDRVAECRHGKAPVKLMNADPSVPNLEGAAFDIPGKAAFKDEKNKIGIQLKEKVGGAYRILISPR